jgi:hypothetical protein
MNTFLEVNLLSVPRGLERDVLGVGSSVGGLIDRIRSGALTSLGTPEMLAVHAWCGKLPFHAFSGCSLSGALSES